MSAQTRGSDKMKGGGRGIQIDVTCWMGLYMRHNLTDRINFGFLVADVDVEVKVKEHIPSIV